MLLYICILYIGIVYIGILLLFLAVITYYSIYLEFTEEDIQEYLDDFVDIAF